MIPTMNEYLKNNPQRLIFVTETQCVFSLSEILIITELHFMIQILNYKPQDMIRSIEHACL